VKKLLSFIIRYWPIFFLAAIEIVVLLTNIPSQGKWLLGWDSTTPELNLSLNLSRFFYGMWQEYRGLGTLDGMAHSANLIHWVYSAVLSIFLPSNTVRPILNLLLHLLGGVGAYYLIKDFVAFQFSQDTDAENKKWISLVGAIFYQFNLLTIQMFFLPLELFSFHFAVLPWALWSLLQYFKHPTTRWLLYFALINVAGASQAHVPTVAISYGLALILPAATLVATRVISIKKFIVAFLVLALVHSFWGLPYLYSTPTKSVEISDSKQNIIGTPSVFYRNNAWARLGRLGTFGGLGLGYQDWNEDTEKFEPIMDVWLTLWNNPLYKFYSFAVFSFVCISSLLLLKVSIQQKYYVLLSLLALWFAFFILLATDIPPFSFISEFLRTYVPLYSQIFRFTFTKFSTVYALAFSIVFCAGLLLLQEYLATIKKMISLKVVASVIMVATLIFAYPAFTHSFFYERLWVDLPQEYLNTAKFINSSDSQNRIATFPIHSLWGWTTNTTRWGYRGSGFFWQMSNAPLVDRSFDPWSKYNETAFLQLNQALYTLDADQIEKTLQKYHINQILIDHSVFHPGNYPKNLFLKEMETILESLGEMQKVFSEGTLDLYELTSAKGTELIVPKNVALTDTVYNAVYTRKDVIYSQYGNYISSKNTGINFPFSYLQSDRNIPYLKRDASTLSFSADLPQDSKMVFTPFAQAESVVPASIQLNPDTSSITLTLQVPIPANSNLPVKKNFPLNTPQSQVILAYGTDVILLNHNSSSKKPSLVSLATQVPANFALYSAVPDFANSLTIDTKEDDCITEYSSLEPNENSRFTCSTVLIPQPSDENKNKLLGVTFDYKSEDFLPPDLCIHTQYSQRCLNKPLNGLYSSNKDWQEISLAVPITDTVPLILELKTSEGGNTDKRIEYSNFRIYYHRSLENLSFDTPNLLAALDKEFIDATANNSSIEVTIPLGDQQQFVITPDLIDRGKVDNVNCSSKTKGTATKEQLDTVTRYLATEEGIVCDTVYLPELTPLYEYIVAIKGRNYGGVGLKFFLTNPLTKRFDLEQSSTFGEFLLTYPVWPSRNIDNSTSDVFSFDITGESYGKEKNITEIETIEVFSLPLNWLTQIHTLQSPYLQNFDTTLIQQRKISPVHYEAEVLVKSEEGLLVLPQSFDSGWIAFSHSKASFPRVTYNGWANGWIIPQGQQKVTIIYWPYLLFLIGVTVAVVTIITLYFSKNGMVNTNRHFLNSAISTKYSHFQKVLSKARLLLTSKLR
jgi:hypothetical protein